SILRSLLSLLFFLPSRSSHTSSDRDWSSDVCSSDLERNPRDLFTRLIYGARISLTTGIIVVLVGAMIGTLVGSIAAYVRGRLERSEERRVGKECCCRWGQR